jgi:hypothetical protein
MLWAREIPRFSAARTPDSLARPLAATFLDRITWVDRLAFTAYGLRVVVRVDDPGVLQRLPDYLPHVWKRSASTVANRLYSIFTVSGPKVDGRPDSDQDRKIPGFRTSACHLYRGGRALAHTDSLEKLLDAFESDLRLYVATWALRRVFVHAGVVGWQGRAVLLPGPSGSGKTRLVAALVRAGATYYSDEYAALDEHGRVHPYLKPLFMREEGMARGKRCPVEELDGRSGTKALPAGLIAFTRHSHGVAWKPYPLSPGRAMLGLLANTVPVRRKPEAALAAVRRVCSEALALEGPRGEAEDVARWLLSRVER